MSTNKGINPQRDIEAAALPRRRSVEILLGTGFVAVLTGILLLLYYRPSANEAFESVQYIMTQVQFGWLIRSIHSWSANLMIFTAFAADYTAGKRALVERNYRRIGLAISLAAIGVVGWVGVLCEAD